MTDVSTMFVLIFPCAVLVCDRFSYAMSSNALLSLSFKSLQATACSTPPDTLGFHVTGTPFTYVQYIIHYLHRMRPAHSNTNVTHRHTSSPISEPEKLLFKLNAADVAPLTSFHGSYGVPDAVDHT